MATYLVAFRGKIPANYDFCYVEAEGEIQAITLVKEKRMLNEHPLTPGFLNKCCGYTAERVST